MFQTVPSQNLNIFYNLLIILLSWSTDLTTDNIVTKNSSQLPLDLKIIQRPYKSVVIVLLLLIAVETILMPW